MGDRRWRVLNQLDAYLSSRNDEAPASVGAALERVNHMVLALAAFSGLGMENMTRGQGWRFADMGRRIERALFLLELVRTTLVTPPDDGTRLLESLLDVADSAITYRRRYPGAVQRAAVLDLVFMDETNPRSAVFQVRTLADHVARLPRAGGEALRTPEERLAIGALARLRLTTPDLLGEADGGTRITLGELLASVTHDVLALADAVTHSYLSHAATSRPLAPRVEGA